MTLPSWSPPAVGEKWGFGNNRTYDTPGGTAVCNHPTVAWQISESPGWSYDAATGQWWHSSAPALGIRVTVADELVTSGMGQRRVTAGNILYIRHDMYRRAGMGFGETPNPLKLVMWSGEAGPTPPSSTFHRVRVIAISTKAALITCAVSNAAPVLTPARAAAMPSVNTTTVAHAGFSMPVSCVDGPDGANNTPLRFTLRDANSTGSISDRLTPVAAGTTSAGVRLQLLRKAASGNYVVQNMGSSWDQVANRGSGTPAVELAVRYIRTGPITPGTIRSQATLTLEYR